MAKHIAYLKREGVTKDNDRAVMFDANGDLADESAFTERCAGDRHHFRFIVSPEDAAEMTDLRAFTRDLARQMETDLGTKLDWVAVDHWNTDNPHIHLLVRGVDDAGADLVIARDYIARGMRSRAEDLVALELGPKPEREIQAGLEREATADRWTRLDREIKSRADEVGLVDLRPERPGPDDPFIRRQMIRRLQNFANPPRFESDALCPIQPPAESYELLSRYQAPLEPHRELVQGRRWLANRAFVLHQV